MDAKVLAGVQSVEAVGVEDPDKVDILRWMIGLNRGCVDSYCAIGACADINLLTFEQVSIGIGCCQLRTDRGLGLGNRQYRATGVADADLPGDS